MIVVECESVTGFFYDTKQGINLHEIIVLTAPNLDSALMIYLTILLRILPLWLRTMP